MSLITNISFIFLIASIQNIGANDTFPDAVVSFWRLDYKGSVPLEFLGVGALIKPNCIFIRSQLLEILRPLKTIGFYTGRSFLRSHTMENSAIVEEMIIYEEYSFLVVKPSVRVTTTFTVFSKDLFKHGQDYGYFIGWNIKFPGSSFLVKKTDILGISNKFDKDKRHFLKVDLTLSLHIDKIFQRVETLQETDTSPYPDAVVSFWSLDEKKVPKELLYIGALIRPNWILIPHKFFKTLEEYKNYAIYTGRKFKKDKITDKPTNNFIKFEIVDKKLIPLNDRLIILVMQPGIRLPMPYTVTNRNEYYGKTSYCGDFIGWTTMHGAMTNKGSLNYFQGNIILKFDNGDADIKDDGAVTKKGSLNYYQGNIELYFEEDDADIKDLPLGSFIVKNNNIIAFFIGTDKEKVNFLHLKYSESSAIMKILKLEDHQELDCPKPEENVKKKARLE